MEQEIKQNALISPVVIRTGFRVRKLRPTVSRKSKLSLENKLIIYKHILKPIWTHGIELWGCSKPSNTKILQFFQSKTLRMISEAPWYVSNQNLHEDLKIPFIQDMIKSNINKYKTVHQCMKINSSRAFSHKP
jgi:hypothetical protein